MRALIFFATLFLASSVIVRAQEESASPTAEQKSYPEVPKEYEVGKETLSPDGRFALLYPVRNDESDEASVPNVLVRLKPYAVLQEIDIGNGVGWIGSRGAPAAKWNGNNFVAVWREMKWGNEDLVIYEIENDKVKRVEKPWPEIVKHFDHDFHGRFLKKYPKESDSYTFVSDDSDVKNFEFKDHKLLLNIFADNKPRTWPLGRIGPPSFTRFGTLTLRSSTKSIFSLGKSKCASSWNKQKRKALGNNPHSRLV